MDTLNLSDDGYLLALCPCLDNKMLFIPEETESFIAPNFQPQTEARHFRIPPYEYQQILNDPANGTLLPPQSSAAEGAFLAGNVHFPSPPNMGLHFDKYALTASDDSIFCAHHQQQKMEPPDSFVFNSHARQIGVGHMAHTCGYEPATALDMIAQHEYEAILPALEYGNTAHGYRSTQNGHETSQTGNLIPQYPDNNRGFADFGGGSLDLPDTNGNIYPDLLTTPSHAVADNSSENPAAFADMLRFSQPSSFGIPESSHGWVTNTNAVESPAEESPYGTIYDNPNTVYLTASQPSLNLNGDEAQPLVPKLQDNKWHLKRNSTKKIGERIASAFRRGPFCAHENKLEAMTINGGKVMKRKTEKQKAKAKKIRERRACSRCQQQKVGCNENSPCSECYKIATDHATALRICLRICDGLVDARNRVPDLFAILSRAFSVGIKIHHLEDRGINPPKQRVLQGRNGYRITFSALPTVEQVVGWAHQDLKWRINHQPREVEHIIDALLLGYVRNKTKLPMFNLVSEVLTIASLGRFLDNRYQVDHERSPTYLKNISEVGADYCKWKFDCAVTLTMRTQLMVAGAVYGIIMAESRALEMIDELLQKTTKAPSWQAQTCDPIMLGICVRRLGLQYRRLMLRYKLISPHLTTRYENTRCLYDAMTLSYSKIYRKEACPFSPNWNLDEHRDAFGNNDELIRMFCQFKIAEEEHYKNNIDKLDDKVYRKVFVERKERRGKRMCDTFSSASSMESHEISMDLGP